MSGCEKSHKQTTYLYIFSINLLAWFTVFVSCENFPRHIYAPMAWFGIFLNTVLMCTEGADIKEGFGCYAEQEQMIIISSQWYLCSMVELYLFKQIKMK